MIKSIPRPTAKPSPASTVPILRFSPYAWAKLLYLRDCGPTEVGGFGLSARDNLLQIEDVWLVRQSSTAVTVHFDDQAVADFFDAQVDAGMVPERFARVWVHTHPGNSAEPTNVDEETFERCFGTADWAVMLIFARGGETYARLQFNCGPGLTVELAVEVDFAQPFPAASHGAWIEEYQRCVTHDVVLTSGEQLEIASAAVRPLPILDDRNSPWWWDDSWSDAFEMVDVAPREDEDD